MPEHLRRMSYSVHGLATVGIDKQHFFVKPSGVLLPVISVDNWADDFSEGLTRSRVQGKIAFFDSGFKQVIDPIYDWAWPFKGGRALVCIGCSADKPDPEGHISIAGGRWGYINRQGAEVVPVRFSKEEILKQ